MQPSTPRERNIHKISVAFQVLDPEYVGCEEVTHGEDTFPCFKFSLDGKERTAYISNERLREDLSGAGFIEVMRDIVAMASASDESLGIQTIVTLLRERGYPSMVHMSDTEARVFFAGKTNRNSFFISVPPHIAKDLASSDGWKLAERNVTAAIATVERPAPPPLKVG